MERQKKDQTSNQLHFGASGSSRTHGAVRSRHLLSTSVELGGKARVRSTTEGLTQRLRREDMAMQRMLEDVKGGEEEEEEEDPPHSS